MNNYVIKSREGKEVTFSIGDPEDPTVRVLNYIEQYTGIPPETALSKCLGHFSDHKLMWEVDPGQVYDMLLAFWAGYLTNEEIQIALESGNVH